VPDFLYKAIGEDGSIIEDVLEAPNIGVVAEKLDQWGLIPLSIKERKANEISLFRRQAKIGFDEVVLFTKQLYTLLKAGVPFLTSLEALAEQSSNSKMREVIRDLYVSVESGKSFSEALSQHPDVFSKLYISSVKAGEVSGKLDDVLARMTYVMEHEKETREKIKAAMRYPMIVTGALVVAFVVLILLVVPKFAAMFQQLGASLPLPTRILIGLNDLFQNYGLYIAGLIGLAAFAFKQWKNTEKGRAQWDEWILRIPVIGDLILKNSMSRFAKMFETLNRSGLPILQTLEIVADTVGNVYIGSEIRKISEGVERGEGIARPLRRSALFPPMVIRMVAIGEQSGSLDEMLANISAHYDVEVDYALKRMTAMIEPLLTIIIAIFIMFLALAIFLPMWNIMNLIQ
jgi:MSHA biogenesis protein MshG